MFAMLAELTAPELTLLFLGVVIGLGAAFVWLFWEIEQAKARRSNGRIAAVARPPRPNRRDGSQPPW
jgi:predicted negative regulator of RcsB-dependent stress response